MKISSIISYIKQFLRLQIVKYALVGGIGIPVHDLALAAFLHIMGNNLYPVALICAFEISTTINFVLNQSYTYREQKGLLLRDWIKRALKAQLTSLSALVITMLIALLLTYGLHISPYIASPIGITCAFCYNFFVSKRFVFRPTSISYDQSLRGH